MTRDITRMTEMANLLRREKDFLNGILDVAKAIVMVIDRDGRIVRLNNEAQKFTGYGLDEIGDQPFFWEKFLLPEEAKMVREVFNRLIDGDAVHRFENHWIRHDGVRRLFDWSNSFLRDSDGKVEYLVTMGFDITESKKASDDLRLAASVFNYAHEAISITDAKGDILDVNEAFVLNTGYSREEVLGKNPRILKSGRQGPEFYAEMWQFLKKEGYWTGEIWNRHKNGEVYAELLTISAVRNAEGETQNYVSMFTDITALKEHQQQLERIAHYDVLTGLPNRVLLCEQMKQSILQGLRRGQSLSVAFIDLDNFKEINDLHGHHLGDELLIVIAQRMKNALREGDIFARLGGDEFVAAMIDLNKPQDCEPVLERLLLAAAEPVAIDGLVLQVSASIGVTLYPQDGSDVDQLIRHANQAMYQAKQGGKNRCSLFDIDRNSELRLRSENLDRIRRAIASREFVLHYQPKVNMKTGQIIGAEALIRWQHPEHGLLPPSSFLHLIENHPLSIELGRLVFETALEQIRKWHESDMTMPVSVNVDACQLQEENFISTLKEMLSSHSGIKPDWLELEILETSTFNELVQVSDLMQTCCDFGVHFALDDFGTGYSSLTYLKNLPARVIKIDQSFVRGMLDSSDDLSIVQGVIALASALGRTVIAEGVETLEHGELLLALGCEIAQGYGIARPMPADEFVEWRKNWAPNVAWTAWQKHIPKSEDRMLIFTMVKHRQWLQDINRYLDGELKKLPPLGKHDCSFGHWLYGQACHHYGEHDGYADLVAAHDRLHRLAEELIGTHEEGKQASYKHKMSDLHAISKSLLAGLKHMVWNNPYPPENIPA